MRFGRPEKELMEAGDLEGMFDFNVVDYHKRLPYSVVGQKPQAKDPLGQLTRVP
ncbi:hypothetical protein ACQP2F_14005 [Actinoplanes sp. CA-030573]|uniref:hypothetical protein n=1 Tax=Actinoplanes sp. CA-030573 TaxID=3239898 RepID=UPI003D94CD4D